MSVATLSSARFSKRARTMKLVGGRYIRASQDRYGNSISVASQDDEGEEFFEEHGIEWYATYCDNNPSGSLHAKEGREKYRQALEDLRAGRINLLWCFDSSRAQRDLKLYAELRDICIKTGSYFAYGGRIYDMSDPTDRKITARDAAEAEGAADNISIHTRRGVKKRAEGGKHAGPRAYGYRTTFCPETDRSLDWTVVDAEKAVIRYIVDSLLNELKSLSWVARQLNADGVPCPNDRRWDKRLVAKLAEESKYPEEWDRFLTSLTPEDRKWAYEVVARVEAGESPKELGRELNREKIPYFVPSRWDTNKVKFVALSRPAAGLRQYHGDVLMTKVDDADAPEGFRMVPIETTWDAIITYEEHLQLVAIYGQPDRQWNRDGVRVKHRWTGIGRCGVCEKGLTARWTKKKGGEPKPPRLRCPEGHVTRDFALLDAWLTEQAVQLLEREDAAELFRVDAAASAVAKQREDVAVLRAQLDGFRKQALDKEITPESFAMFESALVPKIKKAEEAAKHAALPPALVDIVGPDARTAFLALGVEEQRTILRAIMRPRVHQTGKRLRGELDTETIDPGFLYGAPASLPGGVEQAGESDSAPLGAAA